MSATTTQSDAPAQGAVAPGDGVVGRRKRKKSRTRADLMAAGDRLFAARGFDETTTTDIAELADVSQRTLFRHFDTKESLLYGDMDELRHELALGLADRPTHEPILVALREAMLSLADNFERNRDRRLLQGGLAAAYPSVSAYSRAVVQAAWEKEIIAAVAERLHVDPVEDPRPEILAGATMSAIRIATRQWTQSEGTKDYLALIGNAMAAIGTLGNLDSN